MKTTDTKPFIFSLASYQIDAISKLKTGKILCGDVGTGKTRTSIAYYLKQNGCEFTKKREEVSFGVTNYIYEIGKPMSRPKPLYIITTARKRDTKEWEEELKLFGICDIPSANIHKSAFYVDSWNNIEKYINVKDAFFIFDEQRVVGYGQWTKTFLEITKHNDWILLSATPGDCWADYMPVMIANGYYKHKSDFVNQHVIYDYRVKFPRIKAYYNTGKLIKQRNDILVTMELNRRTVQHHEDVFVEYDIQKYKDMIKNRWNPETKKPFKNASELCYSMRKIVNSDPSRQIELLRIMEKNPKVIIFYNFDYELEILKEILDIPWLDVAEWNGHRHDPIPDSDCWAYLVQYTAGCEGWNCITTDTIIFFSQSYSYKVMKQASGRIDRLNTPFTDLYYYHLKARSGIDLGISSALKTKKEFNANRFVKQRNYLS